MSLSEEKDKESVTNHYKAPLTIFKTEEDKPE